MENAVANDLPKGVVLADTAFGNVAEFRAGLRWLDLEYAVGVNATTLVTPASNTASDATAESVEALARRLPRSTFRPTTWKQGSRSALCSRFAMLQVDAGNADGGLHWLLLEWPEGEEGPTHYTLARLRKAPSRKQLVRITKERWRTERVYQDSRESSASTTTKDAPSEAGIITSPSFSAATRSCSPNGCGISPPRADGPVRVTRSTARRERHFEDSFITARLAIARVLVRWLPRCPRCHHPHEASRSTLRLRQ